MPFLGVDPWFASVYAAADARGVDVPVSDAAAYTAYPRHRWVYDKLRVCETQGLPCGPHGVPPPAYPVFSKPIVNLAGMGVGARVVADAEDHTWTPGHFWMPLLEGDHVSTDLVLVGGEAVWSCATRGVPSGGGTFERWEVLEAPAGALDERLRAWCARHLDGHTGVVNCETIDGTIIECHLRCASQFVDLYGTAWLEAVVRLHRDGTWRLDAPPPRGVSLPLFSRTDGICVPDEPALGALRASVRGIYLAFEPGAPLSTYLQPPGGFLVALVNDPDPATAEAVRAALPDALRLVANCHNF